MNSNDTIQHFGIKGMRWGHRNRREALTKKYISKGYNPKAAREKATVQDSTKMIRDRHKFAGAEMKRTFDNIRKEDPTHAARMAKMNADIDGMLNDLLGNKSSSRKGANGRRIKDVTNSLRG